MKTVDLHTHSNASDGSCSPKDVVRLAVEAGLSAVALTDHDDTGGVEEAVEEGKRQQAEGRNIEVIPGIEISAGYKNTDIHILGLFIDPLEETFVRETKEAVKRREQRNIQMVENLSRAGVEITMEDLMEKNLDTVITRAHFARHLLKKGYVKTMGAAFTKYLNPDGPYYVPRVYISKSRAIELIRLAGGVPVLAHPLHYKLPQKELEQLVRELTEQGLAGIEAKYSNHFAADEAVVRALAAKNGLLLSGGSDFHGANKPDIHIGTGRGNLQVPYEYVEKMKEWRAANL